MSATRPSSGTIADKDFLRLDEAMFFTSRDTEAKFKEDFKDATVYRGSKGFLFSKKELVRLQESMVVREHLSV